MATFRFPLKRQDFFSYNFQFNVVLIRSLVTLPQLKGHQLEILSVNVAVKGKLNEDFIESLFD